MTPINRMAVYQKIVSPDSGVPVQAFIAKGPGDIDVLYVASSWGETSSMYNTTGLVLTAPLIASRNLQTLKLARVDPVQGKTEMRMLPTPLKDKFPARYKYTFQFGHYTYFLVVQQQSLKLKKV